MKKLTEQELEIYASDLQKHHERMLQYYPDMSYIYDITDNYVIMENGHIASLICIDMSSKRWHDRFESNYISRLTSFNGTGRELLDEVVDHLCEISDLPVSLYCSDDLIGYYEDAGFEIMDTNGDGNNFMTF